MEITGASVRIRYSHAGYAPVHSAFIRDYPWLNTTLERYWQEEKSYTTGTGKNIHGRRFKLSTVPSSDLLDVIWED